MQRRTVLAGAAAGTLGLTAGCLEVLQDHFAGEIQTPIPIEIHNETERSISVRLEAYSEEDRTHQTYDESYTVTPGPRTIPPHLRGRDQYFRVVRPSDMIVEEASVTAGTQFIRITLHEDHTELVIDYGSDSPANDEPDGNETVTDDYGNG